MEIKNKIFGIGVFVLVLLLLSSFFVSAEFMYNNPNIPSISKQLIFTTTSANGNCSDGADGYTPIYGIDYINGTNGVDGINGTNGVDGINDTNGVNASITQFFKVVSLKNFSSSTTWTPIFTFPIFAQKNYTMECTLFVAAGLTTTGVQFNITSPLSPVWAETMYDHPTTAAVQLKTVIRNTTNMGVAGHTDLSITSVAFPSMLPVKIVSRINNGLNNGNWIIAGKSEVGTNTTNVDVNSWCRVTNEG